MTDYPVHYSAPAPRYYTRLQLAIRVLAAFAFGAIGLSLGVVYLMAFVLLPAYAASRLASDPSEYSQQDAPRIVRALRWLAAIYAWAWLVTDQLPMAEPIRTVQFRVDGRSHTDASHALQRVLTGLPSALVLALLYGLGGLVWLWAAFSVLFYEQVGPATHRYLEGLQRWSLRLLAYQAALVDEYPPFGFDESSPPMQEPTAANR